MSIELAFYGVFGVAALILLVAPAQLWLQRKAEAWARNRLLRGEGEGE